MYKAVFFVNASSVAWLADISDGLANNLDCWIELRRESYHECERFANNFLTFFNIMNEYHAG